MPQHLRRCSSFDGNHFGPSCACCFPETGKAPGKSGKEIKKQFHLNRRLGRITRDTGSSIRVSQLRHIAAGKVSLVYLQSKIDTLCLGSIEKGVVWGISWMMDLVSPLPWVEVTSRRTTPESLVIQGPGAANVITLVISYPSNNIIPPARSCRN
jgi:hypothetical protein